jgi:ERCC4-related helicase
VNRPQIKFLQTDGKHFNDESTFVTTLNKFLNQYLPSLPFLNWVGRCPRSTVDLAKENWLQRLIESKFMNRDCDPRCYQLARSIFESYEIMSVLGVSRAVLFINKAIESLMKSNVKNKVIRQAEIELVKQLGVSMQCLSGESEKLDKLVSLLESEGKNSVIQSRVFVFVKKLVTAKMIKEFLCEIEWVRNDWNPDRIEYVYGKGWAKGQETPGQLDECYEGNDCRLIIATSGLHEALSMAVCDQVVLFNPSHCQTGNNKTN